MNNARRKELSEIQGRVDRAIAWFQNLKDDLVAIQDEEQAGFDNLSEGLQMSEQGQRSEAAAAALGVTVDHVDEIQSKLDEVFESINEATE